MTAGDDAPPASVENDRQIRQGSSTRPTGDDAPPASVENDRQIRQGSSTLAGDRRSPWLRVARALYLLVLAGLLVWVLGTNRDQVADLLRVRRPGLLMVALLTSLAQLVVNAAFWVRALAAMGQRPGWMRVVGVTTRSVPARYVPGSVWYAVSRAGMLRTDGVGVRALGVTALLEAVLTVIVSLASGALLLGFAGRLPGEQLTGTIWTVLLIMSVSPPVLNRLLAWVARRRGTTDGVPRLSWPDLLALVTWMVAFWALSATTFTLYLLAFGLDLPSPVVIAGAFLVAWAVGFLTPIAPQGAGAFEVVFVALIGGPAGPLAIVVAGYRALIGVRDALAFAWGTWRGR